MPLKWQIKNHKITTKTKTKYTTKYKNITNYFVIKKKREKKQVNIVQKKKRTKFKLTLHGGHAFNQAYYDRTESEITIKKTQIITLTEQSKRNLVSTQNETAENRK